MNLSLKIQRHYLNKQKWIPAINRLKFIVKEYDDTIFVEEALHRLVEVYYTIGLVEEAKKYAKLLGYNYQSSEWYEKTYIVFDKMYEKKKKKKMKEKRSLVKKIKSLVE